MLTHHRKPVCLCLISTDLPVWTIVETAATLYQKDNERFHLLLTAPPLLEGEPTEDLSVTSPRLLWLEISPYRVIMTMQASSQVSYRHFWEQGIYGLSRYWLQTDSLTTGNEQIRLRNFTSRLILTGDPLPEHLRVEYELWSEKVQLGRYILNLEIHH